MDSDDRPISALVAQGWEIVSYCSAPGSPDGNVLLRRQKQHKIIRISHNPFGKGFKVREYDL